MLLQSREYNSQLQQTGLYSTLNNELRDNTVHYIIITYIVYQQDKPTGTMPKGAGGIVYDEVGNTPKNR